MGRNWTLLKKFRYVTTVKEFMIKKFLVTMFLGALVPGVGHIYLSVHHPGIMIFLIGLFLRFVTDFLPFPLNWVIFGAYWIWALIHLYRIYKIVTGSTGQVI